MVWRVDGWECLLPYSGEVSIAEWVGGGRTYSSPTREALLAAILEGPCGLRDGSRCCAVGGVWRCVCIQVAGEDDLVFTNVGWELVGSGIQMLEAHMVWGSK